ncbi:General secretion pathway protein N [Labilithrix luteola]|uniref:General secretion pathway protein N n=1 Tax=Labilithrix luteola TaxID=1391654 RepID=A0A0K1Q6G4_9BACT|nr:type II secretion system protein GspN [Labilithrix luteola]AKV01304.1 General secretion pathway protein N [Labilithrix luteola]
MNDATKERLRRFLPYLVYPLFYVFCLAIFLVWTFPYETLKERLVTTFNAQQRNTSSPQELSIESLESWWITGVKATGVKLSAPSSDPSKPASEIKVDEARARASVLSFLIGNKDVSFSVDAFGGTAKGSFEDTGKARAIDVTFDGLDIGKVDAIAANIGFPLEGKLFGTVKLDLPEGKASKGNGNVNLEIRDMFAGNDKELTVKLPLGPFTLPRLKVGNFAVTGDAKDGILKLTKIGASGGDVDVNGEGRVQLREVATDAHLDVNLKFKINDGYRNKNEKTKMLFGAPGSKDKPMLEMVPRMAKSKTPEGYYGLRVGGTLGKPDPQPGGNSVSAGLNN